MTAQSPADLAALKARLYAALKHEKSCLCGECSGGLNAVDALVARCEQAERAVREEAEQTCIEIDLRKAAERKLDEALKRADWLYKDADAKYNEIRSLERERDEAQHELQSLAQDHYFARAESAEARVAQLEAALREIAYLYDGEEFTDPADASERRQDIARAALAGEGEA